MRRRHKGSRCSRGFYGIDQIDTRYTGRVDVYPRRERPELFVPGAHVIGPLRHIPDASKAPSAPVHAKYGWFTTATKATIHVCTSHFNRRMPVSRGRNVLTIPRMGWLTLKLSRSVACPMTLCRPSSLLRTWSAWPRGRRPRVGGTGTALIDGHGFSGHGVSEYLLIRRARSRRLPSATAITASFATRVVFSGFAAHRIGVHADDGHLAEQRQ